MSIYTKKGDKGETSIFRKVEGKSVRVSKASPIISAIGAIDELNSFIGVINSFSKINLTLELAKIQTNLLTIGSIIAGSDLGFSKRETTHLEKSIDMLDREIPPLKNFILPRGTITSSLLQYSRAISRRAEREVVILSQIQTIKPQILSYLNRLSDYLYTLSRWVNIKEGGTETIWIANKPSD